MNLTRSETMQAHFDAVDTRGRQVAANLEEHTARKEFDVARAAYDRRHPAADTSPVTRARAGNPRSTRPIERAALDLTQLEIRSAALIAAGVHPTDYTAEGKELRRALAALGGA